jgi:hypothetical protein
VQDGESEDQQRSPEPELVDLIPDLVVVTFNQGGDRVPQGVDEDDHGHHQADSGQGDPDLCQRQAVLLHRLRLDARQRAPLSRSASPEWRPPLSSRRTAEVSETWSPTSTQLLRARVIAV